MKIMIRTAVILGCLLLAAGCRERILSAADLKKETAPYVEGQVIIAVKEQSSKVKTMGTDTKKDAWELELEQCGVTDVEWIQGYPLDSKQDREISVQTAKGASAESVDFYVGYYEEGKKIETIITQIEQVEDVIKAEPNYICYSFAETAEYPFTEKEIENQWHLEAIRAEAAWKVLEDNGKKPGEGAVVAVVDTGVSLAHSGLINNIWKNTEEENGEEGVDDDENGYIDDIYGVNMVNSFTNMTDSCGHGTMMAGIIGLEAGNGEGVGVAYGSRIMPVKVSKDGNFGTDMAVKGIEYAVQNGADVISMSFGTYYESYMMQTAIRAAAEQCMLVAAAGNEGLPTEDDASNEDAKNVYPAAYDDVIGVMAEDVQGDIGTYSNWDAKPGEGAEYELAAPGTLIYTSSLRGSYDTTTGTSAATAVAAGALAVWRSLYPDREKYPAAALQQLFLETQKHTIEHRIDSGHTLTYTGLDMMDMVEYAMTQDILCDTEKPVVKDETDTVYKAGNSVNFRALVTDNTGVKSVNVYYRQSGKTVWQNEVMTASTQTANLYETEVLTEQGYPGEMAYYLEAYDGTYYTMLGSPEAPMYLTLYKNEISALEITLPEKVSYSGQAMEPDIQIWDNGYLLTEGVDYTVSYENNIQIGTALVYIDGMGYYISQYTTYFFIVEGDSKAGEPPVMTPAPSVSSEPAQSEEPAALPTPEPTPVPSVSSEPTQSEEPSVPPEQTLKERTVKSFQKAEPTIKRTYRNGKKKAKLCWKLSGQKVKQWYVYRSNKRNSGYRLWKKTKKKHLLIRCTKKKIFYKVVAVKTIEGRSYRSKRSEAKVCIRT